MPVSPWGEVAMLKRVQSFLMTEIGVKAVGNCSVIALIVIVLHLDFKL